MTETIENSIGDKLSPVDEVVEVSQDIENKEDEQESAPKLSKYEQQALEKGWVPKDKYQGDLEDYVDAREFIKRGELFDHISKLNKKVKDQEKALEYLVDHNKKIHDVTYKKAMDDLISQQKQAAEMGNVNAVSQITDEIVKLREEQKNAPVIEEPAQIAAKEFIERNKSWYSENSADSRAMQAFAQAKADEISLQQPDLSPSEVFDLTEIEVKKSFAHKFAPAAPKVSSVLPNNPAPQGRDYAYQSLPDRVKKDIQLLQRNYKDFDMKKYINNLRMIGEIK